MSRPLIGITTYGEDEQRNYPLPREYVDAVRRAGGVPLLLPPGESMLDGLVATLDGLILTGGGDLDPVHYNGHQHETLYMLDSERDASDLALARLAIDTNLPTFGICRGTQIINVVLGGTLHEHLPDVVGETVNHRVLPREPTEHAIRVRDGSMLAELLPEMEFAAASWHHQAICDLAEPLQISAHAPDGTIEAVEMSAHAWLIAVQWHPELTAANDSTQQQLFNAFVEATGRSRQTRRNVDR